MKKTIRIQILLILVFAYSCYSTKKPTIKNPIVIKRMAIKDTLLRSVSGTIFGLRNRLESFAQIKLINDINSYSINSQNNGDFRFENIATGKYLIKCASPAHYDYSIELKSEELIKLKIRLKWFDE